MPGTFHQLLVHVVFSTKNRDPWIAPEVAARLHPYMGGICRKESVPALAIGGVEDHVHLLLSLKPDIRLSDLMRTVKSRSSFWVHENLLSHREFAWQEGYAAFAVSKSNEEAVRRYIENQREHHTRMTFQEEFVALLHRNGVEYDERYVF